MRLTALALLSGDPLRVNTLSLQVLFSDLRMLTKEPLSARTILTLAPPLPIIILASGLSIKTLMSCSPDVSGRGFLTPESFSSSSRLLFVERVVMLVV